VWIQTYNSHKFYILNPKINEIDIVDIAHALSNICRFNGHCREFYSVAEHSYRASMLINNDKMSEKPLWALLHDSAEAFIGDCNRPLKSCLPEYKKIEDNILRAIAEKFNLTFPIPDEVKKVDNIVLSTEKRDLMVPFQEDWNLTEKPLKQIIVPYTSVEAKRLFLERFNYLYLLDQK
jgi:hypothetical protein